MLKQQLQTQRTHTEMITWTLFP